VCKEFMDDHFEEVRMFCLELHYYSVITLQDIHHFMRNKLSKHLPW